MYIAPEGSQGQRLMRHGVSASALKKTRIYPLGWLPGGAITVPLPFLKVSILIRKDLLRWNANGELADGPELGPLVHQLCHAHQRLEWGLVSYLWRHLWARLRRRDVSIRFSQVERECHQAARQTEEYYLPEQER